MLSRRGQVVVALSVLITAVTIGLAPSGAAQTAPRDQASRIAVLTGTQSINDTEAGTVALSDRLTRPGLPACLEAPQQVFRCPVCHGFPRV
jgi:hypothetical protein